MPTRLIEVANTEQNLELRRRAVQHLGTMGRTKTGEALVGIYAKEKDTDIKRYVINALFVQNNAESLVAIARKETDPALKREIVVEAVADDQVEGRHGLLDGDLEQMITGIGDQGSGIAARGCWPSWRFCRLPASLARSRCAQAADAAAVQRPHRIARDHQHRAATCRPWPRR